MKHVGRVRHDRLVTFITIIVIIVFVVVIAVTIVRVVGITSLRVVAVVTRPVLAVVFAVHRIVIEARVTPCVVTHRVCVVLVLVVTAVAMHNAEIHVGDCIECILHMARGIAVTTRQVIEPRGKLVVRDGLIPCLGTRNEMTEVTIRLASKEDMNRIVPVVVRVLEPSAWARL